MNLHEFKIRSWEKSRHRVILEKEVKFYSYIKKNTAITITGVICTVLKKIKYNFINKHYKSLFLQIFPFNTIKIFNVKQSHFSMTSLTYLF